MTLHHWILATVLSWTAVLLTGGLPAMAAMQPGPAPSAAIRALPLDEGWVSPSGEAPPTLVACDDDDEESGEGEGQVQFPMD